jgi:amino acid transporter
MSTDVTRSASSGIFARTSSGLVRTVSTLDTLFYCFLQVVVPYVIFNLAFWVFYPGASMELATLVAGIGSICVGLSYALFSSVYPRSGGEYVFLSRTTHPLIGFLASFVNVFWQIFYWGITAVFGAQLGLAPLFTVLGIQLDNTGLVQIGEFFGGPVGWFLWGLAMMLIFGYLLYRGMRSYFRVQRWLVIIGLACFLVFVITLGLGASGAFDFQTNFNQYAGQGAYTQVIEDARQAGIDLSPQFSLAATGSFIVWPAFSFLFAVLSVSFSGEIKDIRRGQLFGIAGANIIGIVLILLVTAFARGAFGDLFLRAAGYIGIVEPSQFPLPYAWATILASILGDNVALSVLINTSVVLLISVASATTAVYTTRGLLAWSIDGMAPRKLSEVSERYHTPTYAILAVLVIGLIHLALYSFTDVYVALSGLPAQSMVFALVPLAAIFFPFLHRETYETSPARITIAGIPLMTISGIVGFVITGFVVYRALIDETYGVNTPYSVAMVFGVILLGAIWYFVARAYRRSQGIDMAARFEEIPVE